MRLSFILHCGAVFALWQPGASAHDSHVHAEAPGSVSDDISGAIRVTEQGKKNLGIEVAEAVLIEIEQTLEAVVEIVPIPNRMAVVASRIPGKVKHISATAGETVQAGFPLVEIESFQAGDPPPSVTYEAPISGIITHWGAAVGESVEPNGRLAEIVDLSELFAEIALFEGQLSRVALGQPVRVYVESFPREVFEGKIELISGKLDPATRSLKTYVRLDNPASKLRPHMRGTCRVVTEVLDLVIGIPHRGVTGDPGNLSVFVQSDEEGLEYEQRRVVLGAEDDRFVEVIEGVLPGEAVVVSGNYQLQFVENKSAIPAGGGHGHDHGREGQHLSTEDSVAHAEVVGDHGKEEGDHAHNHAGSRQQDGPQSLWRQLFGSPITAVLTVGFIMSLGLNVLLISVKKPIEPPV
ncbi:MAG TPA: efflux RND transporter periplasmic adaptor subunit [Verrucomicrobiales bacterium]|nr:efflux RND transporter periplasmic adaptor subunit [Verrucomicrobiales bacterium]